MLRIIFSALILLFSTMSAYADYFDLSVDDEIRKNYNPNQIEIDNGLPPLPKINKTETVKYVNDDAVIPSQEKINGKVLNSQVEIADSAQSSYAKMKKGRIIKLKTRSTISDKMKKGTRVTFLSTYPVSTSYFTIPGGTKFTGEIVDVHRPQFTGNGGLIVIKINTVFINNQTLPLTARVLKVTSQDNTKRIFCNNIKGKRKYISNMVHSTDKGTKFRKKMYKASGRFWNKGGINRVITPVTAVTGTVVWAGNVVASPFIAVFTRGDSITIPKGSIIDVKLTDDFYIYK